MRVHADHHHRHDLPLSSPSLMGDRGGHALLQIGQRRTSYEPRRGKTRQAGTSFESQTSTLAGSGYESQPTGPLNATAPDRNA
jgi:hypothetical protein